MPISLHRTPTLLGLTAALAAAGALLTGLTAAPRPASAQTQPAPLEFLEVAKRTITASDRRQRISIPARRGGYEGIKLRITSGGVLIQKLTVTPRDGDAQAFRVTRFMEEGQETEVIPLSGERRFIRQLELEYGSVGVRGRGADLVVLAKPAISLPSDRVARAPAPVVPDKARERRADRFDEDRDTTRDRDRREFADRDDRNDRTDRSDDRFRSRVQDDRDLLRPRGRLGYDDTSAELVIVGELRIRRSRDTEDLDLRDNRRFTAFAIQARRADVRVREIRVRLGNGETVQVEPRGVLQIGDITSIFDLNAGRRGAVVREVTVIGDKLDRRGPDPELVVLMRAAPSVDDFFSDRRDDGDRTARNRVDLDRNDTDRNDRRDARPVNRRVEAFPALPRAWRSLGRFNLRSRLTRRTIEVGRRAGRFDAVLVRVTGADLRINQFDVTYGNGRTHRIEIERVMRSGDQSAVYLLRGRRGRFIDVIEMGARIADTDGADRARIEVFARSEDARR